MSDDTDETEPFVLLVGTLDSDGVRAKVEASGKRYKVKRIDSSPKNWASICELLESDLTSSVAIKLTSNTYESLASPEYQEASERLLKCVARIPHALFVYEDLLDSNAEVPPPIEFDENGFPANLAGSTYYHVSNDVKREVNGRLSELGFELIPYRRNVELTVLASSFIEEVDQGLLFRMYVPSGQMWAEESNRLLGLFRDYMHRIGHLEVTLKQRSTTRGTVYEFFHQASSQTSLNISDQFGAFSRLLDLCNRDAGTAAELLADSGLSPIEVTEILTRYAKEARRLTIDLKQERERRVLSIRHRLESELVDVGGTADTISQLVEAIVPGLHGVGSMMDFQTRPMLQARAQQASVTVNVQPFIVNAVNSVVAQQILGEVHLTGEDRQILSLIEEHAPPQQKAALGTAVRELADESVPKEGRLVSKQRLKAFLYKLAAKVPDIAFGLLQSYLEKKLGIS